LPRSLGRGSSAADRQVAADTAAVFIVGFGQGARRAPCSRCCAVLRPEQHRARAVAVAVTCASILGRPKEKQARRRSNRQERSAAAPHTRVPRGTDECDCQYYIARRSASIALRLRAEARMSETGRMYLCGLCRVQVVLCSSCDRGNVYCGRTCSQARRRASVREAGRRFQDSRAGRFAHAERARRYRIRRKNVTHHGCDVGGGGDVVPSVTTTPLPEKNDDAQPGKDGARDAKLARMNCPRCTRCGAPRSPAVRLGWLRHRRLEAGVGPAPPGGRDDLG
jgi:hypothetical protein